MRLRATAVAAIRSVFEPSRGGAPAFDPATLFAASEKGTVIEPRTLASLLLNYSSNIAISVAGQAVQMALDKKKGNLLRTPLSKTGWVKSSGDGVVVVSGNTITITGATTTTAVKPAVDRVMRPGITRVVATYTNNGAAGALIYSAGVPVGAAPGQNTSQFVSTNAAIDRVQIASGSATFVIDEYDELPGNHAIQDTAGLRALYQVSPPRLVFDGVNDAMSVGFPVALGSSCTVGLAVPGVGASILTAQTIGTSYSFNQTTAGLVVIDRPLTGPETTNLTAWLEERAFF